MCGSIVGINFQSTPKLSLRILPLPRVLVGTGQRCVRLAQGLIDVSHTEVNPKELAMVSALFAMASSLGFTSV